MRRVFEVICIWLRGTKCNHDWKPEYPLRYPEIVHCTKCGDVRTLAADYEN